MPNSIGAYVRTALNEGTKPCQEQDKRNKAFAEKYKATHSWCQLTITENIVAWKVLAKSGIIFFLRRCLEKAY